MTEKRFVVETVEITDCDTDVSRIAKVITDTKETYSYEDLDEIVDKLNEQQAVIEKLQRSKAYWKKQCKEWEKNWEDLAYEFARVKNMNKELSKDLED